jgi:hypothetical protein
MKACMTANVLRALASCLFVSAASGALTGCSAAPMDQADDSSNSEEALSNQQKTAYNFFISKGLKNYQAAGIVGNLIQESSVNPNSIEYGGGPGRGIAQWSVGGRWDSSHNDNMVWYASQHGLSPWSLTAQLDFIWYELTTFGGYGLAKLEAATNVSAATIAFQDLFEICGKCIQSTRIGYAQQVLAAWGGGSNGGGNGGGQGCYSGTLGAHMPNNACVESKFDHLWYQCDNGAWVDRWTDPQPCDGVHPL